MQRRRFSREFKVEAVKLVRERGASAAQAARDLGVHENVLRKWVKEFGSDPVQAFPGQGQMKPEQLEIERLRREVNKLKVEQDILKKLSRAVARLRAVETASAILATWRVAAVSLLEAQSPLKNVVHGCMRT
jgi:transposase